MGESVRVVDEKGFMEEGGKLLLYFPGFNAILCYDVIARMNRHFEELAYGPLPVTLTDSAGTTHATGVVPANMSTGEYKFHWIDTRRKDHEYTNMFYFEDADRLVHVFMTIKPFLLRNYIHYPETLTPLTYLKSVTNTPETGDDFGSFRENYEIVYIPFLECTFETYNKTNIDLNTFVKFTFAEYEVELIKDKETMKKMWLEQVPVKKIVLPAYTVFRTNAFHRAYNIDYPYPVKEVVR